MELFAILIIAVGVFIFGLVSRRIQNTVLTAPLIFICFGFLVGSSGFSIVNFNLDHSAIHLIAEVTLVLVLFSDASRIDLKLLLKDHNLPLRMLLVGMPLTIILGAAFAFGLFPEFNIWEAALLAAILAPTDAALGQSVVSNPKVPVRIRQSLNVESGLNDGIALPLVLLLACFASATDSVAQVERNWILFGISQVTLGPIAGLVVGFLGAKLVEAALNRRWMIESFEGLATLAIAILAFVSSETIGGNGFIAAFVAGLVYGNQFGCKDLFIYEFMEAEGQLLTLMTFLVFGAALLPDGLEHLQWNVVVYAVLSLTLIRMIPVGLALTGTRLEPITVLFLGWFGPRGLASILFALLILKEAQIDKGEEILLATIITVAMSALLHGMSAAPFASLYARKVEEIACEEEMKPVSEIRSRIGVDAKP